MFKNLDYFRRRNTWFRVSVHTESRRSRRSNLRDTGDKYETQIIKYNSTHYSYILVDSIINKMVQFQLIQRNEPKESQTKIFFLLISFKKNLKLFMILSDRLKLVLFSRFKKNRKIILMQIIHTLTSKYFKDVAIDCKRD